MTDRTCSSCNIEFQFPSKLKRHFESSYHCKKTDEEITDYFKDTDNNIIKCDSCLKTFTRKSSYIRHQSISKCSRTQLQINEDILNISKEKLQILIKEEAQKILNNNTIPNNNLISINSNNTTNIITNETNNTEIINNDTINNDTINNDITSFKYIYLIEKFDVNNKEYIYKFGKINREYSKRIKEHGYEANVLLILDVNNCNVMEKKILNILSNTENIRKCDFGNEYFLCNDKEYIKSIILKNIYN